jgi:hypothetical protein
MPSEANVQPVPRRTTANNLLTIDVNGVPVRKGTMVIPCGTPLYVGQVYHVTPQGHIYVRWFNTRTLEQTSEVEHSTDTSLKWLVPFNDGTALAEAA